MLDKSIGSHKNESDKKLELLIEKDGYPKSTVTVVKSRNTLSLLQGYVYFLNTSCSTFVTVGFSTSDFIPMVQISTQNYHFGIDSVNFTRNQWSTIYGNRTFIEECLETEAAEVKTKQTGLSTNSKDGNIIKIDFLDFNNSICIVFTQNDVSLVLTKIEFQNLMILNDFLHTTLIYNNSVQYFIKEYLDRYIAICKNMNVKKLDSSSYTAPMDLRPPINYFRLFSEIPYMYENVTEINLKD